MTTRMIDIPEAARLLLAHDNILILTHKGPDGDTLGSGFALWAALSAAGKQARVCRSNNVHQRYSFLTKVYDDAVSGLPEMTPDYVVSVDTATPSLFPESCSPYGEKVDLSIDHHRTNSGYAADTLLDVEPASCAEIVYRVLLAMHSTIDTYIASAIYTGVSTDTGCYLYQNTTAACHLVTAELIGCGIDLGFLNRTLFETKTRAQLILERFAIDGMEFYYHNRVAILSITNDMMKLAGAEDGDMTPIVPLPRKVEGVEIGITLREKENGNIKGSVRTSGRADASKICERLGGGGHFGASGFECSGELAAIRALILRFAIEEMKAVESREGKTV